MVDLKKQKGISIIYVVLIGSIIFAIALGINSISYQQSVTMREIGNSVAAFHAADAGAERALYYLYKTDAPFHTHTYQMADVSYYKGKYIVTVDCSTSNVSCPVALQPASAACDINYNFCINSVGESKGGIRRALELKF